MPRNYVFPRLIGLLFLLLFIINPAKSAAQNLIEFPAAYRFHSGDSIHWAVPAFNDSAWSQIPMNEFPLEQWQGSGWFRIELKVDSTLWERPMALMLSLRGAMQVYLDGTLLHTVGKVGDSRENEQAVVYESPRFHPIVFRTHEKTNRQSTHLLVLRYSSFFLKQPAWSGEQPTIFFRIEPLQSAVQTLEKDLRNRTTHQMLISGISITFAILHLALFLFYRRPQANLYFGLIALGFALNVFFDVQRHFSTTPDSVLWSLRLNYTGSLIIVLAMIRLTHSLYYQKPQLQFYGIAILGTILIAATWFRPLTPSIYGQLLVVLSVAEISRTILVSWLRKRAMLLQGFWIIGLGLGLTILFVIYKKMGDFGFLQSLSFEKDIPLDRYGILCLLASISIFLAYNFARLNKNLVIKSLELEDEIDQRQRALQELQKAHSEVETLKDRLRVENIYLQEEIKSEHNFTDIISRSDTLNHVLHKVEQVASTDATVLILGESGTGKELIARAVHNLSPRRNRPLVKVNCAVLPANLIESELFGHEKGAFTGALVRKIGRFELADCGTLFLDEIGELPFELQSKLLRVLQEGEFERLGSSQTLKVDTRIIAATNRNLEQAIRDGGFREDLFYRLNVFPITVPPLRERKKDIPVLVNHFIKKFAAKTGKSVETISKHLIQILEEYYWPGNVRELENVIERAVIVSSGKQLKLDGNFTKTQEQNDNMTTLDENERQHIIKALELCNWRISGEKGAAKILGINDKTLYSRIQKLNISKRTS